MNNKSKKYILSIETTSPICGVSIVKDNEILYENNIDIRLNHSVTLFDNINDGLNKLGINMSNILTIKVSNGPGSFTGLRIGIAAALGLAKPYDTLIEYIDTLDSLAHNYNFIQNNISKEINIKKSNNKNLNYKNGICDAYILSMIDARVDRVYISLYNAKTLEKLASDSIINIEELCKLLNNKFKNTSLLFYLIGSGAVNYKSVLNDKLKINYNILENISNLSASSLAFTKGKKSKVPFTNYLLASKAERELKTKLFRMDEL